MKNNSNTYLYDIAAIILAYLRNEIDEEGQQKLNAWLKESDSHEALFVRILDEKMQYEDIQKILSPCQVIRVALCKGQRYCRGYRTRLFFKRMGKKAYIQCHYRDKKLPVHEYPQRLPRLSKT